VAAGEVFVVQQEEAGVRQDLRWNSCSALTPPLPSSSASNKIRRCCVPTPECSKGNLAIHRLRRSWSSDIVDIKGIVDWGSDGDRPGADGEMGTMGTMGTPAGNVFGPPGRANGGRYFAMICDSLFDTVIEFIVIE